MYDRDYKQEVKDLEKYIHEQNLELKQKRNAMIYGIILGCLSSSIVWAIGLMLYNI